MSFWDEFKKLFQSEQEREEQKSAQIGDALKAENDIVSKLQELEKEYTSSLPEETKPDLSSIFPETLGLEKMDYTAKTDDEIKKQAENELLASLTKQKNAVLERVANEKNDAETLKETAAEDAESSLKELDELYKSLKSKAEKNALKRGLGRSSVITSQLKDYDTQHISSAADVENELLDKIAQSNEKLSELESEKDTALNELDLDYAANLSEKIDKLKTERDATVLKYQKYNNSVSEREAEYSSERAEKIDEYLKNLEEQKAEAEEKQRETESKYGYSGEKQNNYAKRYDIAFEFYNSLSPDIAADALAASPNMKFYLGNYYDKLMDALAQKSSATNKYF